MFSVIMPSYLGDYSMGTGKPSATDKPRKLKRAIDSVLDQTFMDWELILVSDGCQQTVDIYSDLYAGSARIKCIKIPKCPTWSPEVRNTGITNAKRPWIIYLDADDQWGNDHLAIVKRGIDDHKPPVWAYFNDRAWDTRRKMFLERNADVLKDYHHGTSNIVHKNIPGLLWPHQRGRNGEVRFNYGKQDAVFVAELRKLDPGVRIPTSQYFVCHDPGKFDV